MSASIYPLKGLAEHLSYNPNLWNLCGHRMPVLVSPPRGATSQPTSKLTPHLDLALATASTSPWPYLDHLSLYHRIARPQQAR